MSTASLETPNLNSSPASTTLFNQDELTRLDHSRIPKHVAIIMDGNRRWAKQRGLSPMMGHWAGAEVLTDVVRASSELGIQTITVFSFSTENWLRPEEEVEALMQLFEVYLIRKKELMIRDGIRLETIGDLDRFPKHLQEIFSSAKKATEHCSKINLVLALNYGARDEIRRAMIKILELNQKHPFAPDDLTEDLISRHLDTNRWSDPELMIRTSGELRVSNFLLWQISYAEIYVTEKLWPDFSSKDLLDAVTAFQKRGRRLGGG
jgi:undecaprenyl diphosphate synthase